MLLSWQALTLGSELSQTTADAETGVAWLDDVIDVTILSCLIWISKLVCIFLLLLGQECLYILASLLRCPFAELTVPRACGSRLRRKGARGGFAPQGAEVQLIGGQGRPRRCLISVKRRKFMLKYLRDSKKRRNFALAFGK